MKVGGEINTKQLADIFQWLEHQRKTGCLSFTGETVLHEVYFSQGRIAGTKTNVEISEQGEEQVKKILQDVMEGKAHRFEYVDNPLPPNVVATNLQLPVRSFFDHGVGQVMSSPTTAGRSVPVPGTVQKTATQPPADLRSLIIDRVMSGKFKIPLLPTVANKVLQITRRESYSLNDLSKVILTDQVIAANVLKQANSPLFGGEREVSTLPLAIQRIGSETVTKLVFALSLQGLRNDKDIFLNKKKTLWEHSSACAFFARFIALPVKLDHNLAFLCGLMQDFGKMVILSIIQEVMTQQANTQRLSDETIEELLEVYHPRVGSLVGEEWKLPTQVLAAMLLHHSLSEGGEVGQYAAIANLSDIMAMYFGRFSEDEMAVLIADEAEVQLIAEKFAALLANDRLGLSVDQLAAILIRAPECLRAAQELMNV